jgi:hypothetical protein
LVLKKDKIELLETASRTGYTDIYAFLCDIALGKTFKHPQIDILWDDSGNEISREVSFVDVVPEVHDRLDVAKALLPYVKAKLAPMVVEQRTDGSLDPVETFKVLGSALAERN